VVVVVVVVVVKAVVVVVETMGDQKGQALIELSVSIVLLFMIVFGITEFGRYFYFRNTANNAARDGARWAATHPAASAWCANVQSYIITNYGYQFVPPLSASDITVKGNLVTCPSAQPPTGTRVQVIVSRNFSILTGSIIPFFSGPRMIAGDASMPYEL
jgi:hypothetical protein